MKLIDEVIEHLYQKRDSVKKRYSDSKGRLTNEGKNKLIEIYELLEVLRDYKEDAFDPWEQTKIEAPHLWEEPPSTDIEVAYQPTLEEWDAAFEKAPYMVHIEYDELMPIRF